MADPPEPDGLFSLVKYQKLPCLSFRSSMKDMSYAFPLLPMISIQHCASACSIRIPLPTNQVKRTPPCLGAYLVTIN